MKRYFAGPGAQFDDATARVLGSLIEDRGGELKPAELVDEARSDASPLHHLFDWDDEAEAHRHRLHVARQHLSRLQIEVVPNTRTRAVHNVTIYRDDDHAERKYVDAETVMSTESMRKQVLESALRQAESWKSKYESYTELKPIFDSIDGTKKRITRKKKKPQ